MKSFSLDSFRVAALRLTVVGVFGAAFLATSTAPASAQSSTSAVNENIEEVVVVGSRRRDRSASDSPVPIDVIGSDELEAQGGSNLDSLIASVVPSYNVSQEPISDAATFIRPATLRGLSPDATLVLVNGKRRHRAAVIALLGAGVSGGSQGPDVSAIPAIALDRLEVLRDGASSQYGSDAIAGIMNFVLKEDSSGMAFDLKWGSYFEGDGDGITLSGNIGLPMSSFGFANLSFEWKESDPTNRAIQRLDAQALITAGNMNVRTPHAQVWGAPEYSDDYKLVGNFGFDFGNGLEGYAFTNYAERQVEGGFYYRNPHTRGGVFQGPYVDRTTGVRIGDTIKVRGPMRNAAGEVMRDTNMNVMFDPNNDNLLTVNDGRVGNIAGPAADRIYKYVESDGSGGYGDYTGDAPVRSLKVADLHQDTRGESEYDPMNPDANCRQIPIVNNTPDQAMLTATNMDDDCYTLYEKFPGGFTPQFGGRVTDYAFAGGVRGEVGDWYMDFSAVIGSSDAEFYIYNTINPQLFGQKNDIDTFYEAGGYTETDYTINADFSRPFDVGFYEPLNVAFGFETREEEFKITAGERNSWLIDGSGANATVDEYRLADQGFGVGSNGFPGFQPGDAGTSTSSAIAAYVDLETKFSDEFLMQLALRYEDYDDFGDTTDGKIAMRYQVSDTVALRGAFSTGFRVPTAGQANLRNVTTEFNMGRLADVGTLPPTRFNNVALQYKVDANMDNNPDTTDPDTVRTVQSTALTPEESTNLTVGAVIEAGPVDITIDYYNIEIEDRVTFTSRFNLTSSAGTGGMAGVDTETGLTCTGGMCGVQLLEAAGIGDAGSLTSVRFFSNQQTLEASGIDLVVTWPFDLGAGSSTLTAVANFSEVELGKFNSTYTNANRVRQIEEGRPDNRLVLTWTHLQGPWRFMARTRYYGEYYDAPTNSASVAYVPGAEVLFDFEFGYDITSEFNLTLGAQNVFDTYPDKNPNSNGNVAGLPYPEGSPFGFNGGYYYLKARWTQD